MSDFFTRLAQRTLGLAPTLQPRIAPMFAQETQAADAELFVPAAEANTPATLESTELPTERMQPRSSVSPLPEQPLAAQPLQQATPTTPVMPASHTPAAPVHMSEPSASPLREVQATIPTGSLHTHAETMRIEQEVVRELQQSIQASTQAPTPTSLLQPPTFLTASTTLPPPVSQTHTLLATQHVHLYPAVPHTPTIPNTPTMPVQANIVQHAATPPLPALPSRHTPATQRAAQVTNKAKVNALPAVTRRANIQHVSEQNGNNRPAIDAAPAIHVTIGRIEVRATPPATATTVVPRQSTEPVVKSLDEYLQQRAKGGH